MQVLLMVTCAPERPRQFSIMVRSTTLTNYLIDVNGPFLKIIFSSKVSYGPSLWMMRARAYPGKGKAPLS